MEKTGISVTIEERLERYVKESNHANHERYNVLWHAWSQNKRWIMQLLEGTISSFPTYSRHDETHAQTVLHNIEMILGENRINALSATDCFMMLHTVYIHDIGMLIIAQDREKIIADEKFLQMVDYLEDEGDESLRKAVEALKQTDYKSDEQDSYETRKKLYKNKLQVYYSITHLLANFQRGEHGKESYKRLYDWTKEPDKLGVGFSLAGIPQRIFLTIAECARLHTDDEFNHIMNLPQEDNGYVFDYIHPRFISVLLQLGDLLDMDNDRFHPLAMISTDNIPKMSIEHYRKHLAIRKLYICPDIIEIAADCEDQEALRLVRRECDMLIGILQQAGYCWNSICPPNMGGALPTVKSVDLRLNGNQIPKELVSAQFNISQKKAFQILEGTNLYESRLAFLREFLQNAIDATKLQYWKECISSSHYYTEGGIGSVTSPRDLEKYVSTMQFPIEIKMEIVKRDAFGEISAVKDLDIKNLDEGKGKEYSFGVKVQIKDFGTGISQEDLLKISKVGNSLSKERKKLQGMPEWLKPTAEFGVGLQSAFLVTPTFKCRTHTRTEERYEITFGSGALAQYEGYINVKPVTVFDDNDDTYGTRFELFISEDKNMRHEEFPEGWDGADLFDEKYDKRRPLRHSAELMAQMALYLDDLIGESLFPIHLCVEKVPEITIPINTTEKNRIHAIKYEEK